MAGGRRKDVAAAPPLRAVRREATGGKATVALQIDPAKVMVPNDADWRAAGALAGQSARACGRRSQDCDGVRSGGTDQ